MDLFPIINIEQRKEQYHIRNFSLIDFCVGYDDCIYLLFSKKSPLKITGMSMNTRENREYQALILMVDWTTGSILHMEQYNLGILAYEYHFLRPFEDDLLLLGSRCTYFDENNTEKNAAILNREGVIKQRFCLGDGIQDCITTSDGRIITSYFDEGVFGNYGWRKPIGAPGLIAWNKEGNCIWQNNKYDIVDCYAINMDSANQLWFYYDTDFDLVRTDFKYDLTIHPGVDGCNAFSISESRQDIFFCGGYQDTSFYIAPIQSSWEQLGEKKKVILTVDGRSIYPKDYHFSGSKLLFLMENGLLCGYYLE